MQGAVLGGRHGAFSCSRPHRGITTPACITHAVVGKALGRTGGVGVANSTTMRVEAAAASASAAGVVLADASSSAALVPELMPESYEEFLLSNGPTGLVVVDFYADYCGPCKMMYPHYEKMQIAFKKIKFAKFNCGLPGHEAIAVRHRVRSLPTFLLYCGGKPLETMTGANPVKLRQMLVHYNR